ncbi:cation diffusion facilitator family transporter [Atrimonas thermophila]|uniref:cation diffusion facilitator family transporter n=1 Tax=Atrimonas thermophila TaxID=3064161 RepID=UPI00399C76BE
MPLTEKENTFRYVKYAVLLSVFGNLILFFLKVYFGIISHSLAMISDAFHTLSDLSTSVIVLFAAREARRSPDSEHPFGHGRAEDIAIVSMSTLLIVVAFEFLRRGYTRLYTGNTVKTSLPLLAVIILSIITKELMARGTFLLGKKANSSLIKADAWHHRSDALSSLPVVLVYIFPNYPLVDAAVTIFIASLIGMVGIQLLKETVSRLMGRAISKEEEEKIKEVITRSFPEIKDIHSITLHDYGGKGVITLHVTVKSNLSVLESHQLADSIEKAIHQATGYQGLVHIEPDQD